ncbi:hypothetical protein DP107_08170 [Haloglomus irregulare]|jgi:hypothetical protein|uniref:Uncharacterized protein n=1 Tax=Haloglomus irregulare TaxID=2234134 RepID=A0A554NA37_9EURY|nr:hypothetical protein [Haloglomus irregulare]TSD14219.1 hypothetical protein DP107_08170 [Haloglomus irregulare]
MAACRLEVVALAVLLVTAGCSGFGPASDPGDAGPTSSLTPVPVPDDDSRETLAPGLTADGVESPEALANGHAASLDTRSYRLIANRTVRYENGTLREQLLFDLSLGADRTYLVETATAGPEAPVFLGTPPAKAAFWSNGSVYTRRLTRDDETTYTRFRPIDGAGTWQYWARTVPFGGGLASPRGFFETTFSSVPTRVTGRAPESDTVSYRLAGDRATGSLPGVDDPRAVDLAATVTTNGLVRSLTLVYNGTIEGEPVRVRWTIRYENVGNTTVNRPSWTDRALDQEARPNAASKRSAT